MMLISSQLYCEIMRSLTRLWPSLPNRWNGNTSTTPAQVTADSRDEHRALDNLDLERPTSWVSPTSGYSESCTSLLQHNSAKAVDAGGHVLDGSCNPALEDRKRAAHKADRRLNAVADDR